jgi:hypothetical protein
VSPIPPLPEIAAEPVCNSGKSDLDVNGVKDYSEDELNGNEDYCEDELDGDEDYCEDELDDNEDYCCDNQIYNGEETDGGIQWLGLRW